MTTSQANINIMGNLSPKSADPSSHALQPRNAFARLNNDGSLDSDFNAQISIPNTNNVFMNTGGSMGGGNYGMAGYYLESSAAILIGVLPVSSTRLAFNKATCSWTAR